LRLVGNESIIFFFFTFHFHGIFFFALTDGNGSFTLHIKNLGQNNLIVAGKSLISHFFLI